MIASHLASLLAFSLLVSLVFAFLQRDEARARLQFGVKIFAGFVLSTFVLAWVMAQFPR
jgi:hypothetical protein